MLAAGMFGDFNPLHVDEQFSAGTRYGGRILHGPFTSALMSVPLGVYFAGTAIAYLEHNCRFTAPVKPGDTLTTRWTIIDKADKPKHNGGIASLQAVCHKQDGTLVAQVDGKVLVANSGSRA